MTGDSAVHGKHVCLPGNCPVMVPNAQLFCRSHWYMLPSSLRIAVYEAWQNGRGAGSAEHMAAIDAAIQYVEKRVAR